MKENEEKSPAKSDDTQSRKPFEAIRKEQGK